MTVTLRPYQTDLVDGLRAAFAGGAQRVLGVLPTGGGKGRILAHIPASAAQRNRRTYIIAHRGELLDQISANLHAEQVPHGRVQPGHHLYQQPIMIGMVQTIVRRLDKLIPPDLLMIDEAHHAPAGQYRAIVAAWPNARVIGVTATPIRGDGKGLGTEFDAMVVGPTTADLIRAGHLAAYDYFLPSASLDMSGVKVTRGDYAAGPALAAVTASPIVGDAVAHYQRHLAGRPAIAFCMGIQHSIDVAAEFVAAGIRAAHVDGTLDQATRRARMAGLANGTLDVLTAADVISEGVDIPAVAGAILLRPTMSLALFLQQCGRALRPKADGSRAVILDHVGNAHRHGFPADPRAWSLSSVDGKKPVPKLRVCGTCFQAFYANAARPCDRSDCGLLAPAVAPKAIGAPMPGELEAVTDPWAWAKGLNVAEAKGEDFATLMRLAAMNRPRLAQIQRLRGYKPGWVHMMMKDAVVPSGRVVTFGRAA